MVHCSQHETSRHRHSFDLGFDQSSALSKPNKKHKQTTFKVVARDASKVERPLLACSVAFRATIQKMGISAWRMRSGEIYLNVHISGPPTGLCVTGAA